MDRRKRGLRRGLAGFDLRELCRIVDDLGEPLGDGHHIVVKFFQVCVIETTNCEIACCIEDLADRGQARPRCSCSG